MPTLWRKMWLKTLDNPFLMSDNNAYMVLSKLILSADNAGNYSASGREMARLFNLPHSTLYKALVRLEDHAMIRMVATPRGKQTIIKLENWQKYQPSSTPVGKQIRKQEEEQSQQRLVTATENSPGNSSGASRETAGKQPGNRATPNNRGHEAPLDIRVKNKIAAGDFSAREILGFWNTTFTTNLRPLQTRLATINERLKNFTADDLQTAITNAKADDWFNGRGPRSSGFKGDLDYLIKKDETVEKYLTLTPKEKSWF